MSPRARGLIMASTTALSWAVLAIGLKFALQEFSSGTIVWIRMLVAFSILFGFALYARREWLNILYRPPLAGVIAGVMIAMNYFGFMKGVELTTASNAQILIQLAPLGFAIASVFMFKEIPTRQQWLGMLIALTGFGFFYWDQILISLVEIDRFQEGNLWLIVAAATWIVFALIQKKLIQKAYRPQQFNLLMYAVSAVILFPTFTASELTDISPLMIGVLAFLSINTVVAYGALSEALSLIPAAHVSMIIAVNPLLTLAIMTYLTQMEVEWIKGEPIHWRGFLGAFLVVVGVILTVTSVPRLSRRKSSSTI